MDDPIDSEASESEDAVEDALNFHSRPVKFGRRALAKDRVAQMRLMLDGVHLAYPIHYNDGNGSLPDFPPL